jgi:beta-mannanase
MPDASILLGVYDFNQSMAGNTDQSFGHVFPNWQNQWDRDAMTTFCRRQRELNRVPLLTIQPHHSPQIGTYNGLLDDVTRGRYDDIIRQCSQAILASGVTNVCIRWGHEMEKQSNADRYEWVKPNAQAGDYKAAYRHAVTTFREQLSSLQNQSYMWSPAGDEGSRLYYPGDDVVDYVGCSIYSWGRYNMEYYWNRGTFEDLFGMRMEELGGFNKPICVAECGTHVDDDQQAWVDGMFASKPRFPLLHSVIYFNAVDPVPWEPGGPIPDWSISNDIWQLPAGQEPPQQPPGGGEDRPPIGDIIDPGLPGSPGDRPPGWTPPERPEEPPPGETVTITCPHCGEQITLTVSSGTVLSVQGTSATASKPKKRRAG